MQDLGFLIDIDKIGSKAKKEHIEANDIQLKELAERFSIISIKNLVADIELYREGSVITVNGIINCDVEQECVVSLEPVSSHIDEEFEIIFNLTPEESAEDIVLSENMTEPLTGDSIDIGEIIAEQVSLALPAFPQKEGVEFKDHIEAPEALVEPEERTHRPFATLLSDMVKNDNNNSNSNSNN